MAGDHTQPETFDLPPLREIERDGAEAAREQAWSILAETLANNGSVNVPRLNRAGPEVSRIYLELLAQHATPPTPVVGKDAPAPTAASRAARSKPAAQRPSVRATLKTTSAPRATKDWKDLRRRAHPFWVKATVHGLIASATMGVIGFVIILIFLALKGGSPS